MWVLYYRWFPEAGRGSHRMRSVLEECTRMARQWILVRTLFLPEHTFPAWEPGSSIIWPQPTVPRLVPPCCCLCPALASWEV